MSPGDRYVIPSSAKDADGESWIQPRSVEEIVIDAVIEATDCDAADLEPLETYVDNDALTAVFDDESEETSLTFELESSAVTIHSTGDVDVETDE